jgi:Zn-dependent peptidase ImmA (M78 family)
MPRRDTNIGAKRARELRAELGLDADEPLACVLTLAEADLGIPVIIAALPAGVAGCCWRDGERVVLWVNGREPRVRQRFTLAHELGHLRCRHHGTMPVETFVTLSGKATDSREVQANAFAAELLAPAAGVRALVGGAEPGLAEVVRIAATYGLSAIAALYRLTTLGLTRRYAELTAAVEAGELEAVWERLGPEPLDDGIARIEPSGLPWLSPALRGSALAAVVGGSASTEAAAEAAGCAPGALASAAASLGV